MTNRHHERVAAAVSAFKEIIGDSVARQISDAQFRDLDRLIRELVSTELREAADRFEEVARALRSETDIHELGM